MLPLITLLRVRKARKDGKTQTGFDTEVFIYLPDVLCHSLCCIRGPIAPIIIKSTKILQTLNEN